MGMPLGLYLSVPFCRTKCTYCNFASDVFSRAVFERYLDRICADIHTTPKTVERMGGRLETEVDSVYLGGGTPTVLECQQLERLFSAVKQDFRLHPETEVTVECAPGTLTPPVLDTLRKCGVNRVSLGVQSLVDQEAASVGSAIALGVPHVSVYMLEVDQDSRLGRELIAGGTRYHAHSVPDEELTAELYETACAQLQAAGIWQYEISNFARDGCSSRHNLKYWTRQPYLGFGVDAHSMLRSAGDDPEAVRFWTAATLDQYVAGAPLERAEVSREGALEENFFLGLRLAEGIDLGKVRAKFGTLVVSALVPTIAELAEGGLIDREGDRIRLTAKGRLVSNEVFERFLCVPSGAGTAAREPVAPKTSP